MDEEQFVPYTCIYHLRMVTAYKGYPCRLTNPRSVNKRDNLDQKENLDNLDCR